MNNCDAFSHSEQCDQFFSTISSQIGGVEHSKCRCWCHNAQHLFATPELEYDLTPPPEYLSSADRAFLVDEPAHVRVGFSLLTEPEIQQADLPLRTGRGAVVLDSHPVSTIDIHEGPTNKAGFSHWSRKELTSGKCETCEEKLTDCECVE